MNHLFDFYSLGFGIIVSLLEHIQVIDLLVRGYPLLLGTLALILSILGYLQQSKQRERNRKAQRELFRFEFARQQLKDIDDKSHRIDGDIVQSKEYKKTVQKIYNQSGTYLLNMDKPQEELNKILNTQSKLFNK